MIQCAVSLFVMIAFGNIQDIIMETNEDMEEEKKEPDCE